MTVTLYRMPYSPWSERARWALDHHRIPYQAKTYTPLLDEAAYRMRTGRLGASVSVPALITPEGTICESLEIARYAERQGQSEPLFPPGQDPEIEAWAALGNEATHAARALVVRRTASSRAARAEQIPRPLRSIGPLADGLARVGLLYFRKKYALEDRTEAQHVATLRSACTKVREALTNRDTILDSFSFADVCAATMLQGIEPVSDAYVPIGKATRGVWTTDELRHEFEDLLAWRDRTYARHRRG